MSILYFILALAACAVSGVISAFGMRFVIERNREIAEDEDPRDTQIRDLQAKLKLAGVDSEYNRTQATSAIEHVDLAHQRINDLLDEVKTLKSSLDSQEALRDNGNEELELLRNKLSVATKQLDTMRQRNQELEVELSVVREPDLLAAHETHDEAEAADADPFQPTVEDGSPSLIQSLTGELDRWKRHCHVLGDELKNQRQRVTELDTVTPGATAATLEIDELTDIRGIGAVLERKLHKLGIYRYEDLLGLDEDGLERARQLIPDFDRRMHRDNWLEQARNLQQSKVPHEAQHAEFATLS